ncbi:HPP family protein [Azospirillum sp.]|uniref:HPP family protein n=1 Tax=Azospirillum sp. TaxID=34012 RepID=UPI003D7086DB
MKRFGVFLRKMRGGGADRPPARPPLRDVVWSWVGSSVGIGAVTGLSLLSKLPLLIAPLGATCVLIFAVSDSPLAQPRSVVGGYLVSAVVSVLALLWLGSAPWVVACSVGTAIALMQVTRTLHAPAGAIPLLAPGFAPDGAPLVATVLAGALTLTLIGLLVNNLRRDRSYPRYWL